MSAANAGRSNRTRFSSVNVIRTLCCSDSPIQAETTAEETKTRHQNVVVTLDATYREIDEKTRRWEVRS